MKKLLILALLIATLPTYGAIVYTSQGKITDFWAFADINISGTNIVDGDILINFPTGLAQCPDGVYIENTDVSEMTRSASLAAFISNQDVIFQVWNNVTWAGSSAPRCRVRGVRIRR